MAMDIAMNAGIPRKIIRTITTTIVVVISTYVISSPMRFKPIKVPTIRSGEIRKYTYECGSTKENAAIRSGENRTEQTIVKKMKYKSNIWFYGVSKGGSTNDKIAFQHPAIFPEQLAHDHIISWSNEGDLVYDPFLGSGTTAKCCKQLKRNFIGSEKVKKYCEIAIERLKNETSHPTA